MLKVHKRMLNHAWLVPQIEHILLFNKDFIFGLKSQFRSIEVGSSLLVLITGWCFWSSFQDKTPDKKWLPINKILRVYPLSVFTPSPLSPFFSNFGHFHLSIILLIQSHATKVSALIIDQIRHEMFLITKSRAPVDDFVLSHSKTLS